MKLNSIIFHTSQLEKIRDFYEGTLELPTGTFVKNGKTVPDYSDNYVNYPIEGGMLCFEFDTDKTETGTVILNVKDFSGFRTRLKREGVALVDGNADYFKIQDPDGRTIIIEPFR